MTEDNASQEGTILELFLQSHRDALLGFRYQTDWHQHDMLEHWVAPEGNFFKDMWTGDCEDFALGVMRLALSRGVPQGKMYMHAVSVQGKDFPDHCVLEVLGWISDCNSQALYRRDKSRHSFIYHLPVGTAQWYETR